jgi:hypothetical protein
MNSSPAPLCQPVDQARTQSQLLIRSTRRSTHSWIRPPGVMDPDRMSITGPSSTAAVTRQDFTRRLSIFLCISSGNYFRIVLGRQSTVAWLRKPSRRLSRPGFPRYGITSCLPVIRPEWCQVRRSFPTSRLFNTCLAGEPAFRLPKLTQHLALRNATTGVIGLRHPIFGHLSNIAQRQPVRKETVIAWGLQDRASDQVENSRRIIPIFSKLKSQGE